MEGVGSFLAGSSANAIEALCAEKELFLGEGSHPVVTISIFLGISDCACFTTKSCWPSGETSYEFLECQ